MTTEIVARVAAAILLSLLVLSCRTAPVLTPEFELPALSTERPLTEAQVVEAIKRAGGALGWSIEDAGPGHLTGTLRLRGHLAAVDITYTTKSVRIGYKDSSNLLYGDGKIHRNYNNWVKNLAEGIKQQLGYAS